MEINRLIVVVFCKLKQNQKSDDDDDDDDTVDKLCSQNSQSALLN